MQKDKTEREKRRVRNKMNVQAEAYLASQVSEKCSQQSTRWDTVRQIREENCSDHTTCPYKKRHTPCY